MSERSQCSATVTVEESGTYICERKHGHKKQHRETIWVGKGSKAIRIKVEWKERKKHGRV